jgi:heme/copper-type cytochrome/quinol oxidase subunit 2
VKKKLTFLLPLLALSAPMKSLACAACYGQATGDMADGMNWGIFTLLGVVVPVLGGFLAFFIFLIRRSEALAKAAAPQPESTKV